MKTVLTTIACTTLFFSLVLNYAFYTGVFKYQESDYLTTVARSK